MKSSFHGLTPFLPLLCNCQFRRADSIQFLCSQAHIPAGGRLETGLFTLCYCSILPASSDCALLNPSARIPKKTPYSVVKNACLLVRNLAMDVLLSHARVLCLQSRCLAIDILLLSAFVAGMFTEPLRSNGYIRHIIKIVTVRPARSD
jgi:hypothetical protein